MRTTKFRTFNKTSLPTSCLFVIIFTILVLKFPNNINCQKEETTTATGNEENNNNDQAKLSPLKEAVQNGELDKVKELIAAGGADINEVVGESGETLLHTYITQPEMFKFLIEHGANLTTEAPGSGTPLQMAVQAGWATDLIKLLIDAKSNLNVRDANGSTPLHYVVIDSSRDKQMELVNMLLAAGADATVRNKEGKLPVQVAAETNTSTWDLLELLLNKSEKGLNESERKQIEAVGPEHDKWWHDQNIPDAVSSFEVGVVRKLLANGSDPNARNASVRDGQSPLGIAVPNEELVQLLMDHGANPSMPVDEQDPTKALPIHRAVEYGKPKLLKIFLDKKVDVNVKDAFGSTPLHYLAKQGKLDGMLETLKLLLDAGADPMVKNNEGKTPMDLAERPQICTPQEKDPAIVQALKDKSH